VYRSNYFSWKQVLSSKFMHGQRRRGGWASSDIFRTRGGGGGKFFRGFLQTPFMDGPLIDSSYKNRSINKPPINTQLFIKIMEGFYCTIIVAIITQNHMTKEFVSIPIKILVHYYKHKNIKTKKLMPIMHTNLIIS